MKHLPSTGFPIAPGVWAGNTFYASGEMASPIKPGEYGDTKQQTISALTKIQALLKTQGLTMGDVVLMHVYMAGDPAKGGKLDFAGMMEGYKMFFGTKEQPNVPARSAMQVAALAAPWGLVEIEVVAVKPKE
ncbi:MAG: RidA family protein [Acidobacteriaceae bacterium]